VGTFHWVLGLLLSVALGRRRWGHAVPTVMFACCATDALLQLAAIVGNHAAGEARRAAEGWLFLAPTIILTLGVSAFERRIIPALFLCGAASVAAKACVHCVVYSGVWGPDSLPADGLLIAGFALLVTFLRRRALLRARGVVLADRARYDAEWARASAPAEARLALRDLAADVAALRRRCPPGRARQLNRRRGLARTAGSGSMAGAEGMAGCVDAGLPVRSLDRIFLQVKYWSNAGQILVNTEEPGPNLPAGKLKISSICVLTLPIVTILAVTRLICCLR
jgi:hypothetical protein